MQTFLPYPDFAASAAVLDRQRLGKQRVEVLQILRTLAGETKGWQRHPAVLMWSGCENTLVAYGEAVCREWILRGYRDTCLSKIASYRRPEQQTPPSWLGDERFHRAHRSNLLRKDPQHYCFDDVPPDLPYWWPTKEDQNA